MPGGDALGRSIVVKGYVAPNKPGGYFTHLISVVDLTGDGKRVIMMKGSDKTDKLLREGSKVVGRQN